ncbi:MAG: TolC family protein [Spirochaetia bacterium]|jgi:outer membrane protein TolC
MRASIFAVLALGLCATPALIAAADGARVVDLDECIRMGFAHDAGLHSDELETRVADARLREMQGQYVPSVSLQGGYSRLSDVAAGSMNTDVSLGGPPMPMTITFPPPLDNNTSVRISLQQPLFTGKRIAASIRQAEALRDSSMSDLGKSRLDLRYAITEAYWNLARAKTQREAIDQSVAQAESHLADARKLLDQGMATNNDVLQAQMRLEDSKIDLSSLETMRDIARVRLALLIGLPWDAALDIAEDTPSQNVEIPQGSVADLVARALAKRPEIQSARLRVTAQEASVEAARSGLFPNVFLTGDYTVANPNQRVFPQVDQFTPTWSLGILASIDLGRYPQVMAQEEQASSKLTQAQESSRKMADVVAEDVIRAYLTLREAAGRLVSLRQETAQAVENDRVTQERYRQGVALSSESLDAQTLVVRARLREDGALFDCLVARAALDRAVGE